MQALTGKPGVPRVAGFFSPDDFTFGTPLERSALESAIQNVPGVRAVQSMTIGRRGFFLKRRFSELVYDVARDEVIRVENDLDHPNHGSVKLFMRGGA